MQEIPGGASTEIPLGSFYEILVSATPRFWVTPALIAANVLYFVVGVALGTSPINPDQGELLKLGANYGPLTLNGEWWRLLSATFLHIGFVHLAFNMWGLWILGNVAERMFGNLTFLLLYLLSGVGGSLASLLWHPEIVSAGASGAVFGVLGGLASFLYVGHILVPRRVVRQLFGNVAFIIGFNLLFGFLWPGIDNAAHLGGLLVGLGTGAALHRPLPLGRRDWKRSLVVPAIALALLAAARFAREKAASDPALHAAIARALDAEGKRDEAISELERAVELAPKSAELRTTLGYAYLRAERFDDAVSTFRKAIDLDPELYEPQRFLAIALQLAGRGDEAADAFRIARRMKPSDVSVYIESSQTLLEANRMDEAVAVLEEALTWSPDSAAVQSQMGLVRLRRGETGLAVDALRKAAAREPDEAEHYNRLALALSRAGEGNEALDAIEKALELRPGMHYLFDSMGTVRLSRGEWSEAVKAYREAIQLAPDQAVYHYNLSLALERLGESDEADAERKEAFRIDPKLSPPPNDLPII